MDHKAAAYPDRIMLLERIPVCSNRRLQLLILPSVTTLAWSHGPFQLLWQSTLNRPHQKHTANAFGGGDGICTRVLPSSPQHHTMILSTFDLFLSCSFSMLNLGIYMLNLGIIIIHPVGNLPHRTKTSRAIIMNVIVYAYTSTWTFQFLVSVMIRFIFPL